MNMKTLIFAAMIAFAGVPTLAGAAEPASGSSSSSITDAAATSVNILEQNYAASQPVPSMPGMVAGPVTSPSLFNLVGRPAHITGLPLWSQMLFIPDSRVEAGGKSGGTKITFNGIDLNTPATNEPTNIKLNLSGIASGELAGAITIESKPERGHSVDFPTLMHDTATFIKSRKEFKGRQVTLLTVPETMSFTMAVDSKSRGISLSSAIAHFFDGSAAILAGLSGGAAASSGLTAPTGTVGCTFLVLVDGKHNRTIDLTRTYRQYAAVINGQPVNRGPEKEAGDEQVDTKARQSESAKP